MALTDDPILSIANSMVSCKGGYALLLGSGISRAAEIPTGWEIVLDLIGRLARMKGAEITSEPVSWYQSTFGEEPNYSRLIKALAKGPQDRQSLLRGYFEPRDEDDESRRPTKAHIAIGRLVAAGYVKVVVTTNFDRLLERAIESSGAAPTVISSTDSVRGAMPLVHQSSCIIKVHGDYLDARIKNSEEELAKYDPSLNRLLDRVFDEFGLIVCGWSGEWDEALRAALCRCKSHRFSTFWAARGELVQKASDLLRIRRGTVCSIQDADTFFQHLEEKVLAIADLRTRSPQNADVATAVAKKYLSDGRFVIRFHDLVAEEVQSARNGLKLAHEKERVSDTEEAKRFARRALAALDSLCAVLAQCGYWGSGRYVDSIVAVPEILADPPALSPSTGWTIPECARHLPALVANYVIGVAAAAGQNWGALAATLLRTRIQVTGRQKRDRVFLGIDWGEMYRFSTNLFDERYHLPINEFLFESCKKFIVPVVGSDQVYREAFDLYEMVATLECYSQGKKDLEDGDYEMFHHHPGRFEVTGRYADVHPLAEFVAKRTDTLVALKDLGLFERDLSRMNRVCERDVPLSIKNSQRFF